MSKLLRYPLAKIVLMFLSWRIFLFFIAYISPQLIPTFGAKFPYYNELLVTSGWPHFVWSFANFDGVHYLGIARHLYDYQYTQAFFPLYPLLIRFLSPIFMGNMLLTGLIISNTFFLLSLIVFYKLVARFASEKTAFWSILFLLSFPTSFYFGALYTEGLFFFLIILSFYLFEKNKIILSSLAGAFASATRLVGIFLFPAQIKGKQLNQLIPLFIIPVGLFLYMTYLYLKFHNALYFLTAQTIFGQERSTTSVVLLPQVFYRYIKILLTTHGLVLATATFELISTLFAIVILILATKKVKIDWLVFSWFAVLIPTLTGTFASMPRYILMAFPIFIYLATLKNTYLKVAIMIIFVLLLTITTTFFAQGYWVA